MTVAIKTLGAVVTVPETRRKSGMSLGSLAIQLVVLLIAVAGLGWLAHNAAANLAARGIASGFGFLDQQAGFSISEGLVPYQSSDSYLVAFAAGFANTLKAAVPAVLLATLIGLGLGVAQVSGHALLRGLARGVVDLLRNIPLLVQLLIWYIALLHWLPVSRDGYRLGDYVNLNNAGLSYATPKLSTVSALLLGIVILTLVVALVRLPRKGIVLAIAIVVLTMLLAVLPDGWDTLSYTNFGLRGGSLLSIEWGTLVLGLSLYSGVYCAEIVRAGILSVRKGQWEAAKALHLTRRQALRHIVLPQGLRVMVPPYTSLVMSTIKNSSLGVALGYPEIVSIGTTALNQSGKAIECIAVIAAVYLSLNLVTAAVLGVVNHRVQITER